ncbi:OsmC family protein [Cumulibacter soli]|uniref:OsmC family protein n=1 Tax=Cumulibacter soli TaxID=2546344 RepID=UPI00106831A0|nr:OsmC family protein [Cumulibacter soli]
MTEPLDAAALRALQRPLKERYKEDPATALVTNSVTATLLEDSISAVVPTWAGDVQAGLHPATGGDGSEACSADLLLNALAACAGVTLRSVATALGVTFDKAEVTVTGTWDARGTLGVAKDAPVGLTDIALSFDLATDADDATVTKLLELTERYCVIAQTLAAAPEVTFARA